MDIEFDPAKDAANIAKHGMSLAIALFVLEAPVAVVPDIRRDYGEPRFNAFGLVAGRLLCCTYTPPGTIYRVISVRKAHRKEQAQWLP
ncbi:MAG TPA: BrnT family toxin [Roseomonas sp.]|jgi:hypothetical protein